MPVSEVSSIKTTKIQDLEAEVHSCLISDIGALDPYKNSDCVLSNSHNITTHLHFSS